VGAAASAQASASSRKQVRGHERQCRRGAHRDRAGRRAKAGDDPGEGGAVSVPSSTSSNGSSSPSPRLPTREPLVARLAEDAPGRARERLAAERGERLRRAEPVLAPPTSRTPVRRGRATARCRRSARPPRAKPQSVTPRSAASSTARLDGAPTRDEDGQPATAAFCTSSNESRPLTQSTAGEREATLAEGPADDLVHRVVAADVLAQAEQLAAGVEEAGRVQPAGALRTPAGRRAGASGSAASRPRRRELALDARRLDRDRLERALAADAAGEDV
jgi:hypothetical protein